MNKIQIRSGQLVEEVLTITDRPLVYTILSLLELSLVGSPRVVAGAHGWRTPFLNDIANGLEIQREVMRTGELEEGPYSPRCEGDCYEAAVRRTALITADSDVPDLVGGAVR